MRLARVAAFSLRDLVKLVEQFTRCAERNHHGVGRAITLDLLFRSP